MKDKMWDIFEKTGSIEAFLYLKEAGANSNVEISTEFMDAGESNEYKSSSIKRDQVEGRR